MEADAAGLAGPVRAEHAVDVAALETHRHVHDRLDGHLVSAHDERLARHGHSRSRAGVLHPAAGGEVGKRSPIEDEIMADSTADGSDDRERARTGRHGLRPHTTKPQADGPRLPALVPGGDAGETYLRVRAARVRTSTLPWTCEQRAAVSIRWPRVADFDPA